MTKPKLTFDEHLDKADAISAQTPASCINRSDIIRMAREARMPYFYGTWEIANLDGLERFAALVAAHEREACRLIVLDNSDAEGICCTDDVLEAFRARVEQ